MGQNDLIADEGVNQRGSDAEAEGAEPGAPSGRGTADETADPSAPGVAAADDQPVLAAAPEPNEPG